MDSIIERISKDIAANLGKVRKSNGYNNDFTVVRRGWQGNAPTTEDVLCVITQGIPVAVPESSQDQSVWDQPYGITIFVKPDEGQVKFPDELLNSARSDAEKALTLDLTSYNRGGLAQSTMILAPIPFIQSLNHGIQVRIVVRYPTLFNDPYHSVYSNVTY